VESTKAKTGRDSLLCPFPIALSFVLITLSFALLGSLACATHGPKTNGRGVEVTVPLGISIGALADTLAAKQVIASKPLFFLYAWFHNYGSRIRPNHYRFAVGTGERRALRLLSGELPADVSVTIPEGYTMPQVAEAMAERGICRADSFLAACADTNLLRDLGVDGATAEGCLFPETYDFQTGSPPSEVVRRLVRQFLSVFSELSNSPIAIRQSPLAVSDVVILASIVEREAEVPDEFPRIAGVFLNRLGRNMPLQSCATVEYLLPERKGRLSVEDTKLDSPYNTYLHKGLPPGPICSPGRRALKAVLNPERNDYLFFVARGDGTHIFSRTASEHAAACRTVDAGN